MGLLVSNAGAVTVGEFLALERRTVDTNLHLNVLAHLELRCRQLQSPLGHAWARRGAPGVFYRWDTWPPFMADYAAAKAYVLILGQALHLEFQKQGLHLTVLLPGPTATEGVAASGLDLPTKLMSVEQCVAEGLSALKINRATHIAGQQNRLMAALVPGSVMRTVMGTMLAKSLARRRALRSGALGAKEDARTSAAFSQQPHSSTRSNCLRVTYS